MENNKNIEELLEKFYEGETDEKEEAYLRKYFAENTDTEFGASADIFNFYSLEKSRGLKDNFEFKLSAALQREEKKRGKTKKALYYFSAVAAIALITISSAFYYSNANSGLNITNENLSQNRETAELETQKALAALGNALNKADESMEQLKYYNESIEKVENLDIFNNESN